MNIADVEQVIEEMLNPPPPVSIDAERDISRQQTVVTVSIRLDDEMARRADERQFERLIVERLATARSLIMARYRWVKDNEHR